MAGVDGHLFLDPARDWVVTGGLSGSYVSGTPAAMLRLQRSSARYYQRPDAPHLDIDPTAESMDGWNLQVDVNKNSGTFRPNASVWAVSPGLRGQRLGLPDQRRPAGHARGLLVAQPDAGRFSRYRQFIVAKWYTWNGASDLLGDGFFATAIVTFRNYWSARRRVHVGREAYSDRLTRGGPLMRSPGFRNFTRGRDRRAEDVSSASRAATSSTPRRVGGRRRARRDAEAHAGTQHRVGPDLPASSTPRST